MKSCPEDFVFLLSKSELQIWKSQIVTSNSDKMGLRQPPNTFLPIRTTLLVNVPKFEGIRIHAGNSVKDTQGCILVGENRAVAIVLNSRKCVDLVKQKIVEAKGRGESVWIVIR